MCSGAGPGPWADMRAGVYPEATMRGLGLSLLVLTGCSRFVVQVEATPEARVTLNGGPGRGDRWSVAQESAAEIVAVWPDGQRLATALVIDRDMRVLLRKDGDPAQVVGGRTLGGGTAAVPVATVATVPTVPIAAPAGDAMTRARGLVEAGQRAYDRTDYDEAIARFKEAYDLIHGSKDPKAPEILGNILYNLAVVYERSFEVTPDPERLRKARVMYRQFDEQMATLVTAWASAAEHADVQSKIRALDARLGGP